MNVGDGDASVKDPFQQHVLHADATLGSTISKNGNLATLEDWLALVAASKYKEAKLMIRENSWPVNHSIRSHLWLEICRHQAQDKIIDENYYWDTVKQMSDFDTGRVHLPAFVDTCYTMTYHLTSSGVNLANRVISVIGYSYPAITFCPTIYPTASLLLHYMSEEECYNSLCSLISWKQGKFIIQTKLTYDTSWRTMLHLTKKFAKVAYGNVSKYLRGAETPEQIFEEWLWWIFKYLPFSHLVRVMDCFLFEGSKVLYRVAMAILIIFQKYTGKADTPWSRDATANGFSVTLSKFCREIPVTPDKLLKVAFGIRALSQSEINRILTRTEMYLKSRQTTLMNSEFVRSRSTEALPTSQSQVSIQMASHTLTILELLTLWSWLPTRITMYQPQLIYTTDEHGCSLTTFYARVEEYEPTVLVIKTTTNEIFGAYCSTAWAQRRLKDESGQRHTYFGTGETFLFTIAPQSQKYPWVGIQHASQDNTTIAHAFELFMAGDARMLNIGGGNGQGILLDEDIRFGRTETCQTFNNPPLSAKHDFECKVVEVFGFV